MSTRAGFSRHDLSLLLVSLIWGANYSVAKQALVHASPAVFAAVRFLISTSLMLGLAWWFGKGEKLDRRVTWTLLGWGVVGYTLNASFFLAGLKHTSATNSAVIFGSLPVAVALLGILFGHERPRPRVWGGIVLGTAGVALVVGARGLHFTGETFKGDALSVLALISWALFTVGVRQASLGVPSIRASALAHLGGTPGLVLVALPELPSGAAGMGHPNVWFGILYAALLSSVVASVLWTRSLKALGGSRTALYNCVTPLVAGAVAWAFFGERPLPWQLVGAGLVVGGVLVSREPAQLEEP